MKTKSEFLSKYATNPELASKILKICGLTWKEITELGNDAYAADSGAVPGLIYYSDTVPFGKRNHTLILKAIKNFENETGAPLTNIPDIVEDGDGYFNWLVWFSWENTMSDILNYLEND